MKNILQCSICLESLKSPVSLNCGHTFCCNCIQNCFEKSEFCACPLCRQPSLLATLKTDELLPIVEQIYETEGIQSLLNEFPSLIICLCCGLTPVNPVVLPCQHMFCLKCMEESLQQELLCPACSECSVTLNVNTNQKYKDLIDWYLKEFKMEEESVVEQQMQFVNLNGIPLFHYVSGVPIFSKNEFSFLEFRYQEMIKMVAGGSAHFVISKDMKYGDLVKITQIKRTNKGYLVKVEGVTRLKINQVYNYNNGIKIEYQQWNTQLLSFCDSTIIQDSSFKHQITIQYENLLMTLQQLIESSKSSAEELLQSFIQKLKSLAVSESSLIFLFSLNNEFEEEYYSNDIERRITLIQQHLMLLEQKFSIYFGSSQQKEFAKQIADIIEIVEYQDQSIASQYLLNLFNINKILQF